MPDPLMRARHKELDVVVEVPDNDYYRGLGWSKVDDSTPTTEEAARLEEGRAFVAATSFQPEEHTAGEVVEHLAVADPAEAERVLAAEKSGKARKSVLEAAPES